MFHFCNRWLEQKINCIIRIAGAKLESVEQQVHGLIGLADLVVVLSDTQKDGHCQACGDSGCGQYAAQDDIASAGGMLLPLPLVWGRFLMC